MASRDTYRARERARRRQKTPAPSSPAEGSRARQRAASQQPAQASRAPTRTALRRRRAANASRRPLASQPTSRPLASRQRRARAQDINTGSGGVQPVVQPPAAPPADRRPRAPRSSKARSRELSDRLPDPTARPALGELRAKQPPQSEGGHAKASLAPGASLGRSDQKDPARVASSHGEHAKGRASRSQERRSARPSAAQKERSKKARSSTVVPVVPVRDIGPGKRRKSSAAMRARALMVILAIFAGLATLALFVWMTRTVEFKLNNEEVTTAYGTTLANYVESHDLSYTHGNLVSVTGSVIQEGAGDAYAATVNGKSYTPETAQQVMITGGEVVELGNGLDTTEKHEIKIVEAQPKLEFDGSVGVISYVEQWGKAGTKEQWTGKVSGEVTDGEYVNPPQNVVIKTLNIAPTNGRKLVALTFDDGPSSYTPQILDILAQYNVKATFFMLRSSVISNPQTAKMVADAGHQIASHMVHQNVSSLSAQEFQNELTQTYSAIKEATGAETTFFRPPFGAFDEEDWLSSGGLMSASVIWNTDSRDWEAIDASSIVEHALTGVGNGSVILLHDGGGNHAQDLIALPTIIERLQADGYELVTVDELLKSDSAVSEAITSGNEKMPEGSVWPTELADPLDEDDEVSAGSS